jgi:DNA polymerase-3 subunit gamma/tau
MPAPVTAAPPMPVSAPAVPAPMSAPAPREVAVATQPALALAQLDNPTWTARFAEFGIGGVLGTIATHCWLQEVQGEQLRFVLDQRHASFFDPSHCQRMQEQLSKVLGVAVAVQIAVGEPGGDTPAVLRDRNRQQRLAEARRAIADDPNVRLLQDSFGALLDEASIEPLDE